MNIVLFLCFLPSNLQSRTMDDENTISSSCEEYDQHLTVNNSDECHEMESNFISLINLPDIILASVMKYLSLKERYYLSLTCKRLNEVFSYPSLWKVARIHLLEGSGHGKYSSRFSALAVLPKTMLEIVTRFSHLFQHLYLSTPKIIKPFDTATINFLRDFSTYRCRLVSLTLEVGSLVTTDIDVQRFLDSASDPRDIYLLTGLISNAECLKQLDIKSWPLQLNSEESDIFHAIMNNCKLQSLESLSLFYICKKTQWTGRIPRLPSPDLITKLFSCLPNLTHIAIRSPCLDDNVIKTLAAPNRNPLKLLEVLILWSKQNSSFSIPQISNEAWQLLRTSSKYVAVEFSVHTRILFDELSTILRPEVPLAAITIFKFGQCDAMLLEAISSKYALTLTSFISFCDSIDCDFALLRLIEKCENLTTLIYHGSINYKTVIKIVDALKNCRRQLKVFELVEKNISSNVLLENDGDDEVVVKRDEETEDYVLAAVQAWHRDEVIHRQKLDQMIDYVRSSLLDSFKLI